MIIDVRELLESSGHISAVAETTVEDPMTGEAQVPCAIEIDYRQSGTTLYLSAAVEGTVSTLCQRCLEPVRQAITGAFELMVRRGEQEGEETDDVVVLPDQQHELVLDPFIHEAIVINTPMLIVCGEQCRGLCPECGANRNTDACRCEAPADDRWDGLKKST